uniref:Protein kinase domain-containing protein n=1 Tax=Oryza nivara TaxID=4536 RepID=A0A0E0FN93_ORYNI
MATLLCLIAVFLAGTTIRGAVGQEDGFLSIDCGLDAADSGYKDTKTGIVYVSDGPYVDGGENHRVAADQESGFGRPEKTVRSFPSGERNCYALPTVAGAKYLVRVVTVYGNYDGKNSSSSTLQFDLYLGVNYWDTVHADASDVYEALFVARASWAPVCLVKTGSGVPFVSRVDLRLLGSELYPGLTANQSMNLYIRHNMGSNIYIIKYRDDRYDRFWWQGNSNPLWKNISTSSAVAVNSNFAEPLAVMQTAVEGIRTNTTVEISWESKTASEFIVAVHFADFQNSQLRQFNISISNRLGRDNYSPPYLATAGLMGWTGWSSDGKYDISLEATAASKLPPILNAVEAYIPIDHANPMTLPKDFDIIMSIKLEYRIKKNWTGDPCFPAAWDGVKCSNPSANTSRIISLDLSNSNLHGTISSNFTLFTALEYFFDSDRDTCNKSIHDVNPSQQKSKANRSAILAMSVVVPVMAIVVLVLACLIWRQKRKNNISADVPPRESEPDIVPASRKNYGDTLQTVENRRFTYKDLEKITNKFSQFIGQGGFGLVYYGRLEDDTEVAVKMRSELSSHGLDEFLAEVQSLTKVHHRNLVSFVGYCWEKDHLALVYEYYHTGRLTESSDIYNFGVVLLEIVTGESPMLPGLGHIVQRVKKKIDAGNISLVADARLRGAYDVSSMWKVVDIALLCTADIGAQRPTMAAVVVQLKESLALEEARADSGFKSTGATSDTAISMSEFGPLAR